METNSEDEITAPDRNLSTLAEQLNPLRDVGDWQRVVFGYVIAAFAVLFSLPVVFCPIGIVGLALAGEWKLMPVIVAINLMCGLFFALPLFWLARRLLRGSRAGNGVTVLPFWLIQGLGVLLIGAACLLAYESAFNPKLDLKPQTAWQFIAGQLLIGGVMVAAPWLLKRHVKARQTADDATTEGPIVRGHG